jgi:hypothetical protein
MSKAVVLIKTSVLSLKHVAVAPFKGNESWSIPN